MSATVCLHWVTPTIHTSVGLEEHWIRGEGLLVLFSTFVLFLNSSAFFFSTSPFSLRLTELGGSCIQSCVDVDQEDWSAIDGWIATVSSSLLGLSLKTAVDYLDLTAQEGEGEGGFSRTRPFLSTMTVKHDLFVVFMQAFRGELSCRSNTH